MFRSLILASAVLMACGGDDGGDAEPFDTLQMCFDDHHNVESLSVHDAIVVCCIDHPIAGTAPSCGNTAAECVSKLTGTDTTHNLSSSSATSQEVMTACADYETQKNM